MYTYSIQLRSSHVEGASETRDSFNKLENLLTMTSVVIKDLTVKAKAKAKDLIAEAKDLAAEAKAKDLMPRPRPRCSRPRPRFVRE